MRNTQKTISKHFCTFFLNAPKILKENIWDFETVQQEKNIIFFLPYRLTKNTSLLHSLDHMESSPENPAILFKKQVKTTPNISITRTPNPIKEHWETVERKNIKKSTHFLEKICVLQKSSHIFPPQKNLWEKFPREYKNCFYMTCLKNSIFSSFRKQNYR